MEKNYTLIFIIVCFLVSFDIFLVINLFGFTIRVAQLLLIIPIAHLTINTLKRGNLKTILGYRSLIIWFCFLLVFIPNSTILTRNISYVFWMLFNILLIFSTVEFIDTKKKLQILIKYYLYSYLFVGLLGILQFTLSLFGISFFTSQWWSTVEVARVSGFSYEPSYYATYMIMGWAFTMYLYIKRSEIVGRKVLFTIIFVVTLGIILSTSRMGFALLGLWVIGYGCLLVYHLFKGYIDLRYLKILSIFSIGITLVCVIVFTNDKYSFLLSGTGINGTPSHSFDTRNKEFNETLVVFKENIIIGTSLGGIPSARAELRGYKIDSQEEAKQYEGMSIFAEALAASGLLGIIPFIIYIFLIIYKPLKLAGKLEDKEMKDVLIGMVVGLLAILIILQFNQNILRLYLWYHIALLSAIYSVYKKEVHLRKTNLDISRKDD